MYWCEFKSLIYNDLHQEQKQARSITAKQSFDRYKNAFDRIFNYYRLKPEVQSYAKRMHKYMNRPDILNVYQTAFDAVKNEMLQEQYNTLKRNNRLEKKIILEELLRKGLSSVRNELNNVGESSKSGNSRSQKLSPQEKK